MSDEGRCSVGVNALVEARKTGSRANGKWRPVHPSDDEQDTYIPEVRPEPDDRRPDDRRPGYEYEPEYESPGSITPPES